MRRHKGEEKVSDVVIRDIVRDIVTGNDLRWTDTPHEAELSRRYGVGRASLREALLVLEVLGIITRSRGPRGGPMMLAPGGGGYRRMTSLFLQVHRVTLGDVVDSWTTLQPVVVRMAAQRRGSPEVQTTAAALSSVRIEDDAAFVGAARELHRAMTSASGNSLIRLMSDSLDDMVIEGLDSCVIPVEHRSRWIHCSESLATAVLAGQPQDAEGCVNELVRRFREHVQRRVPSLDQPIVWR